MRTLGELTVNIDKEKLLETLHANRRKHEADYNIALANFRTAAINALTDRKRQLEEDAWMTIKPRNFLAFNLPVPQSYAHVYSEVINMLEMCENKTIEVSSFQFQCWVKDKWEWSDSLKMSNSGYMAVGATDAA